MSAPYFVADNADVTILYPLASSAYGAYSLEVPDGIDIDDIHEFHAPGNELGYVANLASDKRVGGFARRFVRADVAVTAANPNDPAWVEASNVDATLQEVSRRVSADFFLGSTISKAGLGEWKPFEHFTLGDIARVDILGSLIALPITRIEPVVSEHSKLDWLVHVGEQIISDEDARLAENDTIRKMLIEDRRDLASLDTQVSKAVKDSSDLAGALGGEGATVDDVKQGMDELAAQHEANDEPPPVGLINAYMQANDERWRMQQDINDANDVALAAHSTAIEANEKAIKVLMQAVAGFLYVPTGSGEHEDARIRAVRSGGTIEVTAKDTWRGSIVCTATSYGLGDDVPAPYLRGDTVPAVEGREYRFNVSGNALIHWQVNPGVINEHQSENLPVTTLDTSGAWETVDSWTVPNATEIMVVSRWTWVNKTFGGDYYGRVLIGGVDVTDRYTSSSAPLFGHGRRSAQVSTGWIDAPAGAVVEVQAAASHGNSVNRKLDNVKTDYTTITDNE